MLETLVCTQDGGREVRPRTRPPRAWHACVRRLKVFARRLERIEGTIGTNAGMKTSGRYAQRSHMA